MTTQQELNVSFLKQLKLCGDGMAANTKSIKGLLVLIDDLQQKITDLEYRQVNIPTEQ